MMFRKLLVVLFVMIMVAALAACTPTVSEIPESGSEQTPILQPPTTEPPVNTSVLPETPAVPQATPESTSSAPDSLVNTSWELESFGPIGAEESVISGSTVTLEFMEDGQAGGQGGCNSFGTQYEAEGNEITFTKITSTLMACADADVTEQETQYYRALETANAFELEGDRLTILYDDGSGSLNFVSAEADESGTPSSGLLCGDSVEASSSEWKVCRSQKYGFEVRYPPDAFLLDLTDISARINLPVVPGTNLSEKYLQIDVIENVETCSSPLAEGYAPGLIPTEEVELEGVDFFQESGSDAGAGNYYDWTAYTTSQNGTCVSLGFVLHSTQPDFYPTPPPVFNGEEETQIFEEIVSTFQWLSE